MIFLASLFSIAKAILAHSTAAKVENPAPHPRAVSGAGATRWRALLIRVGRGSGS